MKSFWNALTAPSPSLRDEEDAERAQLLSAILVPYTIMLFLTIETGNILFPQLRNPKTYLIGHLCIAFYLVLYGISRTRFFKWAAAAIVAAISISVFVVACVDRQPDIVHACYGWLTIATLVCSLVFSSRITAYLATVNVAGMCAFAFLFPETHFNSLIVDLPYTIIMSSLIIVSGHLRTKAAHESKIAKELAERSNRNKSVFLANMSHEIRSPLGVMLGFTDLLSEKDLHPDEKQKFRELVQRNGEHLLALINEILDLTRVEINRLEIKPAPIQLRNEVQNLVDLHRPLAERKGLRVELAFDDDLPETIETDALRLRQALHNLLTNSIKFTHRGEITLLVNRIKDGVRFIVDDTGSGVDRRLRDRLFEPFAQGEPSRSDGSGLGLALSRKLANLLGGDLILDWTEPGKGSRFVLTINEKATVPSLRPGLES